MALHIPLTQIIDASPFLAVTYLILQVGLQNARNVGCRSPVECHDLMAWDTFRLELSPFCLKRILESLVVDNVDALDSHVGTWIGSSVLKAIKNKSEWKGHLEKMPKTKNCLQVQGIFKLN